MVGGFSMHLAEVDLAEARDLQTFAFVLFHGVKSQDANASQENKSGVSHL
jgi:hypothetical protein